jgi:cytochrome b
MHQSDAGEQCRAMSQNTTYQRHSDAPTFGASAAVWDVGVRLFHWSLLIAVATALVTGFLAPRNLIDIHVIAGTAIAALILYRIVWGLTGTTYARFGSFIVGPGSALKHALDLVRGRGHRHVGHNPVGTMMILGLLLVLVALTATGVLTLGGIAKEGPMAPFTSFATGRSAKEIHEVLAFGLLALIGLHVFGVIVESLRTRDNLVRSMVTGRKRVEAGDIGVAPVRARPLVATAITLCALTISGAGIWHWSSQLALGVPTAALDPLYAKECSACHTPHHPNLAPAATWTKIMGGLGDHFGDNATLEPVQTAALLAYLTRNSAETSDTNAANRLRMADPTGSLRITETAGWQRLHRHIDPAEFKASKVAGKLNCGACHADAATGLFHPRSITVPKEK